MNGEKREGEGLNQYGSSPRVEVVDFIAETDDIDFRRIHSLYLFLFICGAKVEKQTVPCNPERLRFCGFLTE